MKYFICLLLAITGTLACPYNSTEEEKYDNREGVKKNYDCNTKSTTCQYQLECMGPLSAVMDPKNNSWNFLCVPEEVCHWPKSKHYTPNGGDPKVNSVEMDIASADCTMSNYKGDLCWPCDIDE